MTGQNRSSPVALLESCATTTPDDICLWFDEEPVTYAELSGGARRAAAGLSRRGVGRGDRYAIFMGNCREFVECWLGGLVLGALPVPINTAYSGEFLRHQLADSGAKLAITDDAGVGAILPLAPELPALSRVLVHQEGPPPRLAGLAVEPLAEALADDHGIHPIGECAAGDPASILYTSGTTGLSKGVVLSHGYLSVLGRSLVDAQRLTSDDVVYLPLPLFHLSGLSAVLTSLTAKSTSIIDRRFSVTGAWGRVRQHCCTGAVFVGPMIAMLWGLPPDPSDAQLPLRFLGGAPIPGGLESSIAERYGCEVVTLYGMTEAFPISVARAGEPFPSGSSGRPNPLFDIRVVDDDGGLVAAGRPGEVLIRARAPHVMFDGYFADGKLDGAQAGDGWFHTGDLCRLDREGFLYFVDRKKDALRRRGENISSLELEVAIRRHPDVLDVAVVGVPSELGEDDVKAVVVLRPGSQPSLGALFEFFDQNLPAFSVPRYVEITDQIPRNQVGRTLKYALRCLGPNERTLERSPKGRSR